MVMEVDAGGGGGGRRRRRPTDGRERAVAGVTWRRERATRRKEEKCHWRGRERASRREGDRGRA